MKMLVVLMMGLVIWLSGCGTHASPSALQHFDRLKGQMKKTTSTSTKLSQDLKLVSSAMQWNDPRHVRRLAIRLKRDARALVGLSDPVRAKIHVLAPQTHSKAAHQYLQLAVAILGWQAKEGNSLSHLADLVWADPLIMSTRDESRFSRINETADWSAWMAVLTARRMAHWRKQHPSQLRYEPVK
jgi:hypothetical protein